MSISTHLVSLTLEEQRYALPLSQVERVLRALEITPLPRAPEIILGVINVRGKVIPVVDVRKRFHLPERKISLTDQIIISHTSRRRVALIVDEVNGVIELPESSVIDAGNILPHMEYVEGVAKLEDGMILIHDLDRFLSLEEESNLAKALAGTRKQ
jgi:purine-binding chemotaxis protein CheW